jgi:hypothetical protein
MKIEQFNYNINIFEVLIWQYENSNNIQQLVLNKNIWTAFYGTLFWEQWYANIFNLDTADLFGLTVWSIILNLPLFVPVTPIGDPPVWGFNVLPYPLTNDNQNFGHGNLAGSLVVPTLTEEEQRIALKLRYYQLVSRGAVTEVNQFLNYIFGGMGGAWMIDNFDMTITYEFGFAINPVLLNVIAGYNLLPKPAGVNVNYIVPP